MSKDVTYKNHTIRVEEHKDVGTTHRFVILDKDGNEIKTVNRGGDSEESAIETAQQMIDFEIELGEQ